MMDCTTDAEILFSLSLEFSVFGFSQLLSPQYAIGHYIPKQRPHNRALRSSIYVVLLLVCRCVTQQRSPIQVVCWSNCLFAYAPSSINCPVSYQSVKEVIKVFQDPEGSVSVVRKFYQIKSKQNRDQVLSSHLGLIFCYR